ncbi:MAG: M56 family metallopeptidase [Nitrospirota bacterium]|nr:M56 family metallopeptidase [Nitrospirota bacterium]
MTIADFFNSWPGMYVAQSFLHALVAALLVDIALLAWKIEDPLIRQPFRLIVIITPIVSFPLFQLLSPERGSPAFRIDALFDINRWLNLSILGPVSVGLLFLLFLGFASLVFLLQEIIPIVRHSASSDEGGIEAESPAAGSSEALALAALPGDKPEVLVIDDDEPLIFSTTGKRPAIYLSSGLTRRLETDELRAAIAHEIGHIARSRRPIMVLVFLLRICMFFNPVVLMEFRRIVQEEEKICDDVAVQMTGNRAALASALSKFYYGDESREHSMPDGTQIRDRIEEYSHTLLIESRITRLEEDLPPSSGSGIPAFAITLASIAGINYFLV